MLPESAGGASVLSPYIRHRLLTLPQVWATVAAAPTADRDKYRDGLLWQEYARHLYAWLGPDLGRSLRAEPALTSTEEPWQRRMACMELTVAELERDGSLVNQTRMWLAVAVDCARWRGLARRRGPDVPPPAGRLPRRQPARLAVDS